MERHSTVRSALQAITIGLLAIAPASAASAQANRSVSPADTAIDIVVIASPTAETGLSPQLHLDGGDVTDTYCPDVSPDLEAQGPSLHCVDVPDGTYDIIVSGVPDDSDVHVECSDVVAARVPRPRIGGGYTNWVCVAYVSPPGVVIGPDTVFGDDVSAAPSLVIRGADGVVVSEGCEPDSIFGSDRAWCAPLPFGRYVAAVDQEADPEEWHATCFVLTAGPDEPAAAEFEISADQPLWSCSNTSTASPTEPSASPSTNAADPAIDSIPEAAGGSGFGSLVVAGMAGALIGTAAIAGVWFVWTRRTGPSRPSGPDDAP